MYIGSRDGIDEFYGRSISRDFLRNIHIFFKKASILTGQKVLMEEWKIGIRLDKVRLPLFALMVFKYLLSFMPIDVGFPWKVA